MYTKSGSYYFVTTDNKWVNLGKDYVEAMRRYTELITPCQTLSASVAGIINKYLSDRDDLAPKTRLEYERAAKYLAAAFDMPASAVESHHVWQYLQTRKNMGSPVAGNREKALLSAAFSHAIKLGLILNKANPCRGTGFRNKEKPRTRLVSHAELEAFLAFSRGLMTGDLTDKSSYKKSRNPLFSGQLIASVIEVAYLTSQRKQNILAIKLQDITPEGIDFLQQKTGVRVRVQWTEKLREAINTAKNLPRPVRSIHLFAQHNGTPYSSSGFDALFQRIQIAWAAQGHERFTVHDMRAAAITKMRDEGVDPKNISGHKSDGPINSTYDRRRVRTGSATE
jgi:integrase